MLVQAVGNLHRFEHVVRITVGAEPDQQPATHHFQRGRAADRVAHIGFRVMHDHRPGFFQDIHFNTVDVDAVPGNCVFPQDIIVIQAVDYAFSIFFQ